jgi:hypothetical protein
VVDAAVLILALGLAVDQVAQGVVLTQGLQQVALEHLVKGMPERMAFLVD